MKASSSTTDRAAAEHATALSLAQQATSSGAGTSTQPHTRAQTAEPADAPTPSRYLPLLAGEWKSPSPGAAAFPDKQKVEYWKEKQRLTSKMGKLLFHGAKELQHTPLTLKDTHPAWQPKKKSPEADKARDRQYLGGATARTRETSRLRRRQRRGHADESLWRVREEQQGASRRTRCGHEERQARLFGAAHCGQATCACRSAPCSCCSARPSVLSPESCR
mmetsp:Transcript_26856/g.86743  ORF Transcript_26856/g.86743 Transcript_26856/m.86743 type:complete len:220 (-) Transcript_26856:172-831(-)